MGPDSLGEDADEGEGEQQLQDVHQLIDHAPQLPQRRPHLLAEVLVQHLLLLLLLQEVTQNPSFQNQLAGGVCGRGERRRVTTCTMTPALNSPDSWSMDAFS